MKLPIKIEMKSKSKNEIDLRELIDTHPEMFRTNYKRVAWGYVRDGDQIVVVKRCKKDDPNRYGELVLPGGGLKLGESFLEAAIRETKEESGLENVKLDPDYVLPLGLENTYLREGDNIIAITDDDCYVWLKYTDSGKQYVGQVFKLNASGYKVLRETKGEDAEKPEWISISEVELNRKNFTPACQILLDLIEECESEDMGERRGILIKTKEKMYRHLSGDGSAP